MSANLSTDREIYICTEWRKARKKYHRALDRFHGLTKEQIDAGQVSGCSNGVNIPQAPRDIRRLQTRN